MSIKDLTDAVAAALDMPNNKAREAVDAVIAEIVTSIVDSGEILVTGLGKFTVKDRPARPGKNPRTGEPIKIAASRKVVFKPAKALRDALNPAPLVPRRSARR